MKITPETAVHSFCPTQIRRTLDDLEFRIEKEASARDLELYNKSARRMADELQSINNANKTKE